MSSWIPIYGVIAFERVSSTAFRPEAARRLVSAVTVGHNHKTFRRFNGRIEDWPAAHA
jgi:hypothetical protein